MFVTGEHQGHELVAQLDAPSSQPGNMHVVHLRNANAVQLAKTLRGMLGKGGGGGNDSSSSGGNNAANSFNQNNSPSSTGSAVVVSTGPPS